jgi:tryptophan synthase beta chain
MSETVKYFLDEKRIPKHWYNLVADLPTPPSAVLHPGTHQPVGLRTWNRCSPCR